jgi:PAS domain S-box-containing protein
MADELVEVIAEQKESEQLLRESEERARLAIGASRLALWDCDLAVGNVYLSEGWSHILGGKQQPTYTTIQALTGLVPEEEREGLREAFLKTIKGRGTTSYQVTHRVRKLDGGLVWISSEGHVADRNRDGRALRMIGTSRDITERILIQQSNERISLLYKMLSETNSANIHIRDRDRLFETVCRIAVESGLFRMAWIGLLDRESGTVVPVAQSGHVDGYLDRLEINIFDDVQGSGPTGMAIKSSAYVACGDIASDPRMAPWRDEALKRGYHACIVYPLMQSGQVIGAFSLYFHDAVSLTGDVIQLLGSLVEDISFTLDFKAEIRQREQAQNELRELSVFLQSALENERKRIARELHDELGQTMTALHFDLKWLQEYIGTQEHEVMNRLRAMQDMLGRTVDTVRRISEDLRPGMLDDLGLTAAIEHHAAKFEAQTGIVCGLEMSHADYDLDEPVATALFRIVQESLTNVARHSGASRVTIHLKELGDKIPGNKILLVIQDDGCGLPARQPSGKKTYGLLGMRERIKMLGGTLDMFNEAGAGARIEVYLSKYPVTRTRQ